MSEAEKKDAGAETQHQQHATDHTRCAECKEFEKKKEHPLETWFAVGAVGAIAALSTLLVTAPLFPASSVPIVAMSLGFACLMGTNVIGQLEFAFLDARGLLHRHLRMPMKNNAIGSLGGRFVANVARFDKERMLRKETDGTHGSDGAQFLVDGAILQLHRGGWFRKVRIADRSTVKEYLVWMPHRCQRGLDDLVLRSVDRRSELRLGDMQHLTLRLINDPTSDIAQLYHDRRTLQEECTEITATLERERKQYRAAIAEKDAQIKTCEEESAHLLRIIQCVIRDLVVMLAHFEFGKHTVGRSRHAAMLRKLIAHALVGIAKQHLHRLHTSITDSYGEILAYTPDDFGEYLRQHAEDGAQFLAALDAIAQHVEQERKTTPQDASPPAAPPSA